MSLINCPECGKEVSGAAAYCPWCGHRVNATELTNTKEMASRIEPFNGMIHKKPYRNKKVITFVLILFALIIFTGGFYYINYHNKQIKEQEYKDIFGVYKDTIILYSVQQLGIHVDILKLWSSDLPAGLPKTYNFPQSLKDSIKKSEQTKDEIWEYYYKLDNPLEEYKKAYDLSYLCILELQKLSDFNNTNIYKTDNYNEKYENQSKKADKAYDAFLKEFKKIGL